MTPLRQRMLDAMVLRGFAQRTQWTYVTAVKQLARYHDCSPALLSDQQIQAYLLHLLQERHRSRSTVNTTSCAIRFLVCDVLGQRERRVNQALQFLAGVIDSIEKVFHASKAQFTLHAVIAEV